MNLTLKDIAQALGISITTVSKALKDYKDVNPQTRARVRAYAEQMNFRPNAQASFLRTQKTGLLGLVVPHYRHDFFNTIVETLITQAEEHNYRVVVLCSEESYEKEKKQIHELLQLRVDGIFISVAKNTNDYQHLKQVLNNKTPLILFDRKVKLVPTYQVVNNDQEAAYQATEHLISQGCKKIAHLRGDLMPQISIDRFLGYKKALEQNQIPYEEDLVAICSENNFEEGFNSVLKLLEKHPDLDGLFAITDLVAVGALRAFEERGYRVPEDVAVIGFSNWMISSLITPQLSTVEQNGARIGKKVLQLFLKTQESDTMEPVTSYVQETVRTQLLIRASSKRKEI